jgi:DNA-binding FadR family transcriptional regulator/bacterioferritin-associated ferredoxin
MLVCHCTVVNDRRIRELVDDGAVDLLDVASATGAGSFCGGCQPAIASVISRVTGEPASALLARAPSGLGDDRPPLPTRVLQVVRSIEEDLRTSGWTPGRPVDSELDLATRYDASRGTVRDAVAVLVAHGILRRDGTDGHVVARPAPDVAEFATALHLYASGASRAQVLDVRRVLERLAVQCACAHPDPEALTRYLAHHRDAPEDGVTLHAEVGAVTGNPVLVLLLGALRRLSGPDHDPLAHGRIADAVAAGDARAAEVAVEDLLDDADATAGDTTTLSDPPRSRTDLGIAARLARLVAEHGLGQGEVIGTEREVAADLGLDRRALLAAMPVVEHHAVATRQPGPRATLAVATPDPWPSAELLALALDWTDTQPGQLLHVRQALELRAVELASQEIDTAAAGRLRQRLDEESVALRRDRVRDQVFHTIHPVIATLSGNHVLAHAAVALNLALLRRANREPELARFLSSSVGELARTHAAIVDATTSGDTEESRRLAGRHGARYARHEG